jgi:hypothetical protein
MTANLEQFTRDIDALIDRRVIPISDPALQTATVLLALDLEAESTPPADLRARWIARAQPILERKSFMQTLRTRPFVAILIALIVLLTLSGVAYALGRVFGYIPGVGIVEQSAPIRVLAEPVTMEQNGMTVTVSKVVADSTRTFVAYRVDGIRLAENGTPVSIGILAIRLPDGTNLEQTCCSGGTAILKNETGMYFEDEFISSPIPNGINNVTLVLFGGSSENWEIPLEFVPAPAGYATPAVEMNVTADGAEDQTGLHLQKVLELENSYILVGKFTDGGDLTGPLYMSTSSDSDYLPRIEDTNGNPVSFEVREDSRPDPDWDVAYYWAYEIPKPVATPLTITVDSVNIRKHNTAQFQFDAGDHPQVGQEWNLNLFVQLGASDFIVESVTFLGNGYTFTLSDINLPEGVTPDIEIPDNSLSPFQFDSISSTVDNTENKATITLTTTSLPPLGKLTIKWGLDEYIPQPGPWSLTWTPSTSNP